MNGIIYFYRNKTNGKCYIGQTTRTMKQRAGKNGVNYIKENSKSHFAQAINKHGWDSFEGLIIFDGIKSKAELDKLEKLTIKLFDTYENGYNSTLGGGGSLGCHTTGMYGKKHTDEAKKKNREAHLGLYNGERHPMFGKTHTEEAKQKIREARKKQVGENHPMWGKSISEEHKQKLYKKVRCIELNKEFESVKQAKAYMLETFGVNCHSNIPKQIKGERRYCGKIIVNNVKTELHWEYI